MKRLAVVMGFLYIISAAWPAQAAIVRNCDKNAVVFCGAETPAELQAKLASGDGHNTAQNLTSIYGADGITASSIGQTVEGVVTKDGRVLVNNVVVATGAQSAGRQFMTGSTAQGSVFIRPTSVSFANNSLPAFVSMPNNQFAWAIVKACGNPVVAQPVRLVQAAAAPITPRAVTPTPAVARPLPHTGSSLSVIIGIGLLWFSIQLYRRSRNSLLDSLLAWRDRR